MKLLYLALLSLGIQGFIRGQVLYNEFYFEMPIDKAKEVLKNNSKTLKNISFGKGTS